MCACVCVCVCLQVFLCVEEAIGENKIGEEGSGLIFFKIILHSMCLIQKVRERHCRDLSRG